MANRNNPVTDKWDFAAAIRSAEFFSEFFRPGTTAFICADHHPRRRAELDQHRNQRHS